MKMSKEMIIAIVVVALLLFGIGFVAAKKIKKKVKRNKSGKTWLGAFKKAKKEVDKQFTPNFEPSRYGMAADALVRAMDGGGTNEDLIRSTMKTVVKNSADWMELVAAFGLREDSSLADWFVGDLSDSELLTLSSYLKGIGVKPENIGF